MKQICPYCGSENGGNAFCMQCGKLLLEDTELEPQRTVERPRLGWANRSNRVKGIALLLMAIITLGAVAGAIIILSNTVTQTTNVNAKLEVEVWKPIPEVVYLDEPFTFAYGVSTEMGFYDQSYKFCLTATIPDSFNNFNDLITINNYTVYNHIDGTLYTSDNRAFSGVNGTYTYCWFPVVHLSQNNPASAATNLHLLNITIEYGFPNQDITFNAWCEQG